MQTILMVFFQMATNNYCTQTECCRVRLTIFKPCKPTNRRRSIEEKYHLARAQGNIGALRTILNNTKNKKYCGTLIVYNKMF